MFDLTGKRALLTGAGSGIGREIARKLAEAGAYVFVTDVDPAKADETAALIGGVDHCLSMSLDVTSEPDCDRVRDAVLATVPALDILVNNAGIGCVGKMMQTTGSDMDRLYQVNVRGIFNVTRRFLPGMVERRSGSIINLSSIGGLVAVPDRFAYCMSKFAVTGMTKSLAIDYAESQVRVNCICPGRVETPFVSSRLAEYEDPEAARRQMTSTQPLGRMGRPEEIGWAAVYLASDEAAFVTGAEFNIDGGWNAG